MSDGYIWRGTALVAAMFGIVGVAHATTFSVSTDFSTASNPNGVWTYGYETILGGTLHAYDISEVSGGIQNWRSSAVPDPFGVPNDANNPTATPIGSIPAHMAEFHPGPNGEFSVYRFTAPLSSGYDLLASFAALNTGGTDVHILENGTQIYAHEIDSSNTPESFSQRVTLNLGDRIDFAVGVGTDGNYGSDATSIAASLTTVPEPGSLAVLGSALAGLGFLRRRKRKRPLARLERLSKSFPGH